ncbi:MAG: transpeptidase family protein [Deltaproteobacteria bacterium]|nr:transpeptidase family protein [Deltaproteobacteria bacterium]
MINLGYLRFRILVIFFIAIFFFLFIVGRALQLQVVPNQKLRELASRQYKTAVTLSAQRGTFYDRHMNELAISRKVGSIFANPKTIKNKRAVALRLSGLTGVSASKILQKLKLKKSFVWIDRLVEDSVTARLLAKPILGVGLIYEYKRFYNNQELASQVLGLTDIDSQGIEGVEYGYNPVLQGQKKSLALLRDAYGRIVSLDETLFMESQEGHSLVLSLDKSLQFSVEKELEAQAQKFKAKNGLAIVQNAQTGEILAMAHYPFFNPNRFHPRVSDPSQKGLWKNRSVVEAFEPGSTFKVILAAAALEEGVSPQDTFFCEQGFFRVNRKDAIREAQSHKYGWLTLSDILKYSSNICAAKVALQIGKEAFYRKIVEFGFGGRIGIDVPGEASGIVRPLKTWEKIDLSTISFGQGISVTALQLVSSFSAIANGGKLMKPFLVKKIIDANTGEIQETKPQILHQVMSAETAKKLTGMLKTVMEKDGTGYFASLDDTPVAGKTGTAQKPNLEKGGYLLNKHLSSFLGFFPAEAEADEPKYTILVLIDEPQKQYYASLVAAPLFKAIALHTLRTFPQRDLSQRSFALRAQDDILKNDYRKLTVPAPSNLLEEKEGLMPDLKGKSMRQVLEFAQKAGLIMNVKGSGIAVSQSIPQSTPLVRGQRCSVTFKPNAP